MSRSLSTLRDDALAIWGAALEAVRSDRLVYENVRVDGRWLLVGDPETAPLGESSGDGGTAAPTAFRLTDIGRIAVVGAGKAGAGMARGVLEALGPSWMEQKQVAGWLNVPADCVDSGGTGGDLKSTAIGAGLGGRIHLHAARPAGVNEPTAEGVAGTQRILEMVRSLGPTDICLCLISGGGSALLPAPVEGVSLAEKQTLTRLLSSAGANIRELNTVRKQLSRIKGGGLARACRAGQLITLIISDVLGDPLDVIASGPTVPDMATAADALAVLERYGIDERTAPAAMAYLQANASAAARGAAGPDPEPAQPQCEVTNLIIGNNALAVDAAGIEAERRGYSHAMDAATQLEGPADEIGRHMAQMALQMRVKRGPDCLITGGEPTVKLAPPEIRGLGGRNQHLVLAALCEMLHGNTDSPLTSNPAAGICLLSGGTDGEDGPTDAAGAIFDEKLVLRMRQQQLDPADFLCRSDAYNFFKPLGGLIHTGPTHTNVCDVRVVIVDRVEGSREG